MKKFVLCCCFAAGVCSMLSSCYAILKAERFVYQGTIAKKPVDVQLDSVTYTSTVPNN